MTLRVILAGVVALQVAAALVPFRFDPPRYVSNRLERTQTGRWRFDAPSMAHAPSAPSWVPEAMRSETLTVDLRVKSGNASQSGPARILTNSADFTRRNIAVAQQDADLVVRVRRPGSDPNGEPSFVVPDVLQPNRWRDITVAVRPSRLSIDVDGVQRIERALPPDALAGWNPNYGLALGNEVVGERPWSGEVAVAEVTTSLERDDLLATGRLVVPDGWWHVPDRLRAVTRVDMPVDAGVAVLHLLAFVPVGYLLARAETSKTGTAPFVTRIGALSLMVELVKVVVAGRHPSLLNFVAQIVGGLGGAVVAVVWPRWMWPRR